LNVGSSTKSWNILVLLAGQGLVAGDVRILAGGGSQSSGGTIELQTGPTLTADGSSGHVDISTSTAQGLSG